MKSIILTFITSFLLVSCTRHVTSASIANATSNQYSSQDYSAVKSFCSHIFEIAFQDFPRLNSQSVDSFNTARKAVKVFDDGRNRVYYTRTDTLLLAYLSTTISFSDTKSITHVLGLHIGLPTNAIQAKLGIASGDPPKVVFEKFGKPKRIMQLQGSLWKMSYAIVPYEWSDWQLDFVFSKERLLRTDAYTSKSIFDEYF